MDREERKQRRDELRKQVHSSGGNRVFTGVILFAIGGLLLARQVGADIPGWMFQWYMILIIIGLLISVKSGFRNAGGLIMILIGVAFMLNDIIPNAHLQNFIWPGILIVAGIMFMLKPRQNTCKNRLYNKWDDYNANQDNYKEAFTNQIKAEAAPVFENDPTAEYVEINAVFGSINRLVLSKNFKGGEVNAFMGGAEINLLQADVQKPVQLEVNAVFGGAKLVVPGNWHIKNETTAVFGGVEDKRNPGIAAPPDPNKVIVLKGACVFGGIEIRNF